MLFLKVTGLCFLCDSSSFLWFWVSQDNSNLLAELTGASACLSGVKLCRAQLVACSVKGARSSVFSTTWSCVLLLLELVSLHHPSTGILMWYPWSGSVYSLIREFRRRGGRGTPDTILHEHFNLKRQVRSNKETTRSLIPAIWLFLSKARFQNNMLVN